jgi:hypothetical protein
MADKNLEAVEKALNVSLTTSDKNFAPPEHRSVVELIGELEDTLTDAAHRLENIKKRLALFNQLQSDFFNGGTNSASASAPRSPPGHR